MKTQFRIRLLGLALTLATLATTVGLTPAAASNGTPATTSGTIAAQQVCAGTLVVRQGDTLSAIARRCGTTVAAIMQINGLASSRIYVGQALLIPSGGPTTPPPSAPQNYIVQRGDTLSIIARRFNRTVEQLLIHNGLRSTTIYVGQRLLIPGAVVTPPPASSTTYTVQRGDTLTGIARRTGRTVAAIMAANNLRTSNIYVGQLLMIPEQTTTTLGIWPPNGRPGTLVKVTAYGFAPNQPITIAIGPVASEFSPVLEGVTDSQGNFTAQVPMEGGIPGTQYVFGASSGQQHAVSGVFTVN